MSDYKTHQLTGGIHPPQHKTLTCEQPIGSCTLPKTIILPLQQHLGLAALPLVKVGDYVQKGQKIAQAQGIISVPIHASTSGTVIAIESHPIAHHSGMSDDCIIIETDGQDQWLKCHGVKDYHQLNPLDIIDIIHEAGIAGLGGAGFPTAIKLNPKDSHIHTLILNGTECEPYITADDLLMQYYADDIIQGLAILAYLIKPKYCLIGVEDNKPQAITALNEALNRLQTVLDLPQSKVVNFPTKYPSGGEKQLIQILTGKEVPQGCLPADIGIVCQNVGTAASVYHAVVEGKPLISRITTFTGKALRHPQNLHVLLGTPVRHCLHEVGLLDDKLFRLIMGGPMMGFTINNLDVPVVKTSNCFIAAVQQELPPPKPAMACIRCGLCAEVCPVNLLPQQLYWYAQSKQFEVMQHQFNLRDCIECGACAYVCPSHIPLVQYYRAAKGELRQKQQQHLKADVARSRFENRQQRLEQEKQQRLAKRKQQQARSQQPKEDNNDKKKAISEALARVQAKKMAQNQPEKTTDPVQRSEKPSNVDESL